MTTPQPPAPTAELETVARAICKSRTCEGAACCQWPANRGRTNCPVDNGGYDDAAQAAITALARPDGEATLRLQRQTTPHEVSWFIGTKEEWLDLSDRLMDSRGVDYGDLCKAAHFIEDAMNYAKPDGEAVRTEIVKWLRDHARRFTNDSHYTPSLLPDLADAIERGDFRPQSGEAVRPHVTVYLSDLKHVDDFTIRKVFTFQQAELILAARQRGEARPQVKEPR